MSSHLHQLVVKQSGLLAELNTVWDVFLLGRECLIGTLYPASYSGRGELALAFITTADSVLKVPPGGATQHDTLQVT